MLEVLDSRNLSLNGCKNQATHRIKIKTCTKLLRLFFDKSFKNQNGLFISLEKYQRRFNTMDKMEHQRRNGKEELNHQWDFIRRCICSH